MRHVLILLFIICASILPVLYSHELAAPSIPSLLSPSSSPAHLVIPITIVVGLLGLEGNGDDSIDLSPSLLLHSLSSSLPVHSPSTLHTQSPLPVQYSITYQVQHISHSPLTSLEQLLSRSMRPTLSHSTPTPSYEIQSLEVEPWITKTLYTQGLAPTKYSQPHSSTDQHLPMSSYAVLIVNPSLNRMTPGNTSAYQYHYRYGRSAPTQVWLAKDRFVYVDLSATAAVLTTTDREHGANEWGVIPKVEKVEGGKDGVAGYYRNRASPMMVGRLSTLIIHAVQQVFLPDLTWPALPSYPPTSTLIVPLIVLRNHRRFHPFQHTPSPLPPSTSGPTLDIAIDLPLIRAQLTALFPYPTMVVPLVHDLHTHQHLSSSLWSALKEDTAHRRTDDGTFEAMTLPYLSSSTLFHSLSLIQDDLLSALPSSSTARVFPVYIFSLLGLSPSLLIDRHSLYATTTHSALVLQTGNDRTPSPFLSQDGPTLVNAQSITRHILSAITVGVAGVVPPFLHVGRGGEGGKDMDRFTEGYGDGGVVHSYQFSVGCHTFGPFVDDVCSSQVYIDHIQRNAVIMKVTSAMHAIDRGVDHLRRLHLDYGEGVEEGVTTNGTWRVFLSSSSSSPLLEQMRVLIEPLGGLRDELMGLRGVMERGEGGEGKASDLLDRAKGWEGLVEYGVGVMRGGLECCDKEWRVEGIGVDMEGGSGWVGWIEVLLGLSVVSVGGWLVWWRIQHKHQLPLHNRRRV